MKALAAILALAVAGAGMVVAGVAVLAGAGWAMVAAGAFLLGAASFLRRGLTGPTNG